MFRNTQLMVQQNKEIQDGNFVVESSVPLLNTEDVTEDNEFWLVQCPKNIDPNVFLGHEIEELMYNSDKYELVSHSTGQNNLPCIMKGDDDDETFELVLLPVEGQVCVSEVVAPPDNPLEELPEPKRTPFPEDLRIRHPLFGRDYESKIIVKDTWPSPHKKKKKKKGKEKEKRDSSSYCFNEDEITDDSVQTERKKKKHKHSSSFTEDTQHSSSFTEDVKSHKRKRHEKSQDYGEEDTTYIHHKKKRKKEAY